jgi:hypothetical protein
VRPAFLQAQHTLDLEWRSLAANFKPHRNRLFVILFDGEIPGQ